MERKTKQYRAKRKRLPRCSRTRRPRLHIASPQGGGAEGYRSTCRPLGVEIETAIRSRVAAADAIPRQAGRGAALIVMGVARRTGEELFFGETATGLLQRCPCPVVLISDSRLRRDDEGREELRSGTGGA
ncbi:MULTISPECIES: universal stress protein [unclassified Mesorhizobium]|uniref:universal stress protein n=1 Tax=unclassified Mesorhizobium TaxID=325217 RepID=UPI003336904D